MQNSKVLLSALHFLITLIFLALGFFFFFLKSFPHFEEIYESLMQDVSFLHLVGGVFFAIAGFLFLSFYLLYEGQYYRVSMSRKGEKAFVDIALIKNYAKSYLHQEFKGEITLQEVLCPDGKKIELVAKISPKAFFEQDKILRKIEREFSEILEGILGYEGNFFFTAIIAEKSM